MKQTIIIAGSGPSAPQYEWGDTPIMAVSSGCDVVPRMDHFVTLDKMMHFPRWLTDSDRFTKHIPNWDNEKEWRNCPYVRVWPYEEKSEPTFVNGETIASGSMLKSNVPAPRHNSLLFAVQVAARLGFKRCVFIGCDLLEPGHIPVADMLRQWWPIALQHGIEWQNASPLSTLCEWMPNAERMMQLA